MRLPLMRASRKAYGPKKSTLFKAILKEYFCELLYSVTVQHLEISEKEIGEEIDLTKAELSTAIISLKAGKASVEADIRLEMLNAINNFKVCWLIGVFQVAWKTGEVPKQWQTSVLIPIYKKGDQKKCTHYRSLFFINFSWKGLFKVP